MLRKIYSGALTSQNPNKRQRTTGPIFTKYSGPPTPTAPTAYNQQLHAQRRGYTHPQPSQTFQHQAGVLTPISVNSNQPGAWQQHNWLPSPPNGQYNRQWTSQGLPTPNPMIGSHHTSPISSNSNGTQHKAISPTGPVQQQSPAPMASTRPNHFEVASHKGSQQTFSRDRAASYSRQQSENHVQPFGASIGAEEESPEEPWWEELRALDYSEASFDSRHVGKST
jgi:hypothetical protein